MLKLPPSLDSLRDELDRSDAAVLISDRAGNVLWVNGAYTKLNGYGRDEAMGKAPGLQPFGEHTGRSCASFWRSVLSMNTWTGEVVCRTQSGVRYRAALAVTPVPGQDGRTAQLICASKPVDSSENRDLAALLEAVLARTRSPAPRQV